MFLLYDLIFLAAVLFFLPVYLLKGKLHSGFFCRLGILPRQAVFDSPLWIHAVSVGEVMAIKEFTALFRERFPGVQLVISTVTLTGNKVARELAQGSDVVIYLPLDFSFIVRSVARRVGPRMFLAAETEFWPNLLSVLRAQGVPLAVVNGRISDRSLRGYSRLKPLIRHLLRKLDLFCVQTQDDASRLAYLGAAPEKISVTGNMKFDSGISVAAGAAGRDCRQILGLKDNQRLIIAGSTHQGEEDQVLSAFRKIRAGRQGVRLLIAPRHPQRANDVAELVRSAGFNPLFISGLESGQAAVATGRDVEKDVFILDGVGRLFFYYSAAYAVYVGGSLVPKGGHNVIEPAFWAKPVLCGEYTFNFKEIISLFVREQACIIVKDNLELSGRLAELLDHPDLAEAAGKKARRVLDAHRGASARTLELISRCADFELKAVHS